MPAVRASGRTNADHFSISCLLHRGKERADGKASRTEQADPEILLMSCGVLRLERHQINALAQVGGFRISEKHTQRWLTPLPGNQVVASLA